MTIQESLYQYYTIIVSTALMSTFVVLVGSALSEPGLRSLLTNLNRGYIKFL